MRIYREFRDLEYLVGVEILDDSFEIVSVATEDGQLVSEQDITPNRWGDLEWRAASMAEEERVGLAEAFSELRLEMDRANERGRKWERGSRMI